MGDRQRAHAGPGDDEAKGAAKHEEDEPFSDELSEQPPPAGTEGRTNRDLAATSLGADHQEAGEIRARDEQHQAHAGLQHPEGAPRRTDDFVQHR